MSDSPFLWAQNRRPSVFATDPAFRPKHVPRPSGKSAEYHIGAHTKAVPAQKESK